MKKNRTLRILSAVIGGFALVFTTSCEGPQGPAGHDGTDGVDGNAVCMECHNLTVKNEVTAQYLGSQHAAADFVGYAGGRKGCAMCHSDQGFVETQYTGQDTTAADIASPQAIQCHTCHSFHNSLDFENEPNSALRTSDPVELLMYRAAGQSVTIDLGASSNLCANCHQPRRMGPDPADDSTRVTSSHYGPHHGPQTTSLAGLGAYELGSGYPNPGEGSTHVTNADCTTCHMHGSDHHFEPTLDGCNTAECHNGSITTLSDNSRQNTFKTLLGTLETKLKTAGLLDVDGHPVVGTYPSDEVGALYNYEWILDDRSSGVHNFPYLETLLNNSIAVFP